MEAVVDRPPISGLVPSEDGGGDRWICLYRAVGDIEAHLLAGRLEAAGIETSTIKDHRGAAWLHGGSDPFAPIDVMVKKLQFDDARLVLAEISYEQPFEPPGATPKAWKTALVWWGAALALGLAFTGIAFARTSAQLQECGASWQCEDVPARP